LKKHVNGLMAVLVLLLIVSNASAQKQPTFALCSTEGEMSVSTLGRALASGEEVYNANCGEVFAEPGRWYIAQGNRAAKQLLRNDLIPEDKKIIVGVFTSDFRQLTHKGAGVALFIEADPPLEAQLALARALFGEDAEVLIPYMNGTLEFEAATIESMTNKMGVKAHIVGVANEREMLQAIKRYSYHVDSIIALPDRGLYNRYTIGNILRTSYGFGIPVLGFSSKLVGLGSLATTQLNEQIVVDRIMRWVKKDSSKNGSRQNIEQVAVVFNSSIARSLNLIIDQYRITRKTNNLISDSVVKP